MKDALHLRLSIRSQTHSAGQQATLKGLYACTCTIQKDLRPKGHIKGITYSLLTVT